VPSIRGLRPRGELLTGAGARYTRGALGNPAFDRRLLTLGAIFAAGACGGGQTRATPFDPAWVDDRGAGMADVLASLRAVRVPLGSDVAVGVVGKKALVGIPLDAWGSAGTSPASPHPSVDGGKVWTFEHVIHGRPAVAGAVVVAAGGNEVFALEARTGKLLWSRSTGGRLRGAGDDGATTVVSLIPTTGFGSLVLAVRRDGTVARQIEEDERIGVPAVAGDTIFFPWQGRFLSAFDIPTGDERGRLSLPGPMSRAFAVGGALFAGEATFTRLDARLRASPATASLPEPLGGFPSHPTWTRPGTDWVNREADDHDKIRLYARPTVQGPPGVEGGRFAATYFNVALGLDAGSGRLAWAHAHRADFLGGAAAKGGFVLCDAGGGITLLDARTGGVAARLDLEKPVVACLVQADGLTIPPAPNPVPVGEQVARILALGATELAPVQEALRGIGANASRAGSP
jgi:outer membrane protein assembly factor BamB